jgi:hypothetical protein
MANTGLVKTYDAKLVSITYNGIIVNDFADGDFVAISGLADNFEFVQGADGSENRNNKNITGADVVITCSQTSTTNDLFSVAHTADKLSNTGKGALLIKDLNGTTLLSSGQAYIKGFADTNFGNALTTRAWNFRAPNAIINVGSNL